MKPVLVTGAAGFIGYHLSERLMREGRTVIGYDCLSDYYSVELKQARVKKLQEKPGFTFVKAELEDAATLKALFEQHEFDLVYNLAAQAGVRYSLVNPQAYVSANLEGFMNILECCRYNKTKHLVFASSSSVYGAGTKMPFSVHQNVDHPLSVYAASKKANELSPNQPALMDTLSAALELNGRQQEAVANQRKAVAGAGANPNHRLRLAQLLVATGDRPGARAELETLQKLGDSFPRQDEVTSLLRAP